MAKTKNKKSEITPPAPTPAKKRPTQAKIVLPPDELEAIRVLARSLGMTLATFLKFAVKQEVARRAKPARKSLK